MNKILSILTMACFTACFSLIRAQTPKEFYIDCNPDDFAMIYAHYNEEIYIPVSITHNGVTIENAQMRIRGDGSVVLPKKSLKVKIDGDGFNGITVFNFNADYEDKSYMQAYIVSRMMREAGVACFQLEHVRLYLNGQFLGLYLSVENMDEKFIERNGFNANGNLYKATLDGASLSRYDNVYYHWEQKTGSGNRTDLQSLIFMLDSIKPENYKTFLENNFDYEALINILAVNLLTRNNSTYYHNYYMFHDVFGSQNWFMFPWDLDKCYLYYEFSIPYYHTSRFWAPDNPLMELAVLNQDVMADLSNRIDYLHETLINNQIAKNWTDSLKTILQYSVAEDQTDNIESVDQWLYYIERTNNAFDIRYAELQYQFRHLIKPGKFHRTKHRYFTGEPIVFNWDSAHDPNNNGISYRIYIGTESNLEGGNAIIIEDITDTVYVFNDTLPEGMYFTKLEAYNSIIRAEAYDNYNIFFVDNDTGKVVINEINYHPSPDTDTGEWVELFNNSSDSVNISQWKFSDGNNMHLFTMPDSTILAPYSYVVLTNDLEKLRFMIPECTCAIGNFDFKLDNEGELIRLYNRVGRIVDSLHYLPVPPWPTHAAGLGKSLELTDPSADNSDGSKWLSSTSYGSPCKPNQHIDSVINPDIFQKLMAFPNPIVSDTNLRYYTGGGQLCKIEIIDIYGKSVFTYEIQREYSGYYVVNWQAGNCKSGMYIACFSENGLPKKSIKLVIL